MGHDHSHHHHHHEIELTHLNKAFIAGIVLNSVFVVVEVIAGFLTNSMALLTDAGHNLSDVAALAMSLLAFKLLKVKPDEKFTYGYSKTTVLVALGNAVILLIAIGGIGFEAIHRFFYPEPMKEKGIIIVASIGIVINSVSALLFLRDKDKDLNVKGAYLHLAVDALVSLGVVLAGIAIYFTGWYWLDSAISIVIMIIILISTWRLLTDSLKLTMDAVPHNIKLNEVKEKILNVNGIYDIHHIHIWAISTRVNALTAHLVIDDKFTPQQVGHIKDHVKHELLHMNIQHATLETECRSDECSDVKC